MSAGATYLSPLIADPSAQKVALAVVVGALMVFGARSLSSRLATANGIENAVVPTRRLTLFGAVDFMIESFVKYHDSVLGKSNRNHIPFTATIFFFILATNLLGLVPGFPAVTTTVWVNVGMALVVFVYFNAWGVKAHGVGGYLLHFAQPLFLAPFMFPLEIFSTCLRVLTLNLRLYWNMSADHMVLDIFTGMLGPVFPVILYVLGTFVSFMQAFIFTTLTMVYILLATQHEEGAHH